MTSGKYKKTPEHCANLSKSKKGKKLSEEHKIALSLAKIGIKHGHKTNNGRKAWNNGISHTEEHKSELKISRSKQIMKPKTIECRKKMSDERKGDKWYTWKGGITPINLALRNSFEYKIWRKSVFSRDDYTCVLCGKKSGKGISVVLNADHIMPFSKFPNLRFNINNGRTLCVGCHKKTDTFGPKVNNIIYE